MKFPALFVCLLFGVVGFQQREIRSLEDQLLKQETQIASLADDSIQNSDAI